MSLQFRGKKASCGDVMINSGTGVPPSYLESETLSAEHLRDRQRHRTNVRGCGDAEGLYRLRLLISTGAIPSSHVLFAPLSCQAGSSTLTCPSCRVQTVANQTWSLAHGAWSLAAAKSDNAVGLRPVARGAHVSNVASRRSVAGLSALDPVLARSDASLPDQMSDGDLPATVCAVREEKSRVCRGTQSPNTS